MTTHYFRRPIDLQRPLRTPSFEAGIAFAGTLLARLAARWATYVEYRRAVKAERELAQLSPSTLQDIGAPQGLVGQRRWQDELQATRDARILRLRGW